MRTEKPEQGTESEWFQRLLGRARRYTACEDDAADLALNCLHAFFERFGCYPWQHPDGEEAFRWLCQKLRSLWWDARREAQRHPCLSLEACADGVALVEMGEALESEMDVALFLAWLPEHLRAPLALRLQGYSWEEAARLLGRRSSTLRAYLPELRSKFVEFFGFDPSKRASESLMYMEGETTPSETMENGELSDADDEKEARGFSDDTGSAGG